MKCPICREEGGRNEIYSCPKGIFLSQSRQQAMDQFNAFESKWPSRNLRPVYNMERNLRILLEYCDYTEPIR
jgi:hypothetical protein